MHTLTARTRPPGQALSDQHVVLIPGFLGFNRLGDFGYFADTVGSAIADALARLEPAHPIGVHVFETVPAGSLRARQRKLIDQLKSLRATYPQAELHLVGHSTGGLDAELLLRTPTLATPPDAQTDAIRRSIRSVTTIAAPLSGTSLARSPLARFLAIDSGMDLVRAPIDLVLFRGPSAVLGAVGAVIGLFFNDPAARSLSHAVLHSGVPGATYFLSLLLNRALIDELAPDHVERILADSAVDPALSHVRRARFMTIARREPKPHGAGTAGLLFRFLYDNTAREAQPDPEAERVVRELTARPDIRTIGVRPTPTITLQANDGIVDTARQLLPCTPEMAQQEFNRLAALVIADHIDVIGYFPGKDGKDNGFLTSGSDFRKPQFDALYAAVAEEIAKSIPDVKAQAG